jgi:hypothetical protein
MHTFLNILWPTVGIVITLIVLDAALRTFVVPRGSVVAFTFVIFIIVRRILDLFAPASRG